MIVVLSNQLLLVPTTSTYRTVPAEPRIVGNLLVGCTMVGIQLLVITMMVFGHVVVSCITVIACMQVTYQSADEALSWWQPHQR